MKPLARAANDNVTTTNDSGVGSLRQAILDENSAAASFATFGIGAAIFYPNRQKRFPGDLSLCEGD